MARGEIGRHLATDTRVCRGRLIFRGTRILVADALELLNAGWNPDRITREYQGMVSVEAIEEAVAFNERDVARRVRGEGPTIFRPLPPCGDVFIPSSLSRRSLRIA